MFINKRKVREKRTKRKQLNQRFAQLLMYTFTCIPKKKDFGNEYYHIPKNFFGSRQ